MVSGAGRNVEQGAGRQLNGELVAAKALAKAQRDGARENAARVNELKRLIDELQVSNDAHPLMKILARFPMMCCCWY